MCCIHAARLLGVCKEKNNVTREPFKGSNQDCLCASMFEIFHMIQASKKNLSSYCGGNPINPKVSTFVVALPVLHCLIYLC